MEPPNLSIAVTLIHYGAKNIPSGYGWKQIRCPFHNDRMASASVNTEINGFRCHGCEVSGDPIKIIRSQEGISFKEAIAFANDVIGASVDSRSFSQSADKPKKRRPMGRNRWREIL